jgi:hypothetical protein
VTRRRRALVIVAAALAVLAVGPQPLSAATPQEDRLRPPVYGTNVHGDSFRNFADPSIVRVGNTYWAYSTHQTGTFARRIMVMSSTNLWDWSASGQPAPNEALARTPNWARPLSSGGAFWAPSVIRAAGRFVMYFGAKHKNVSADRPGWCIGVATSADANGPFEPRDTPLFCRVNSTHASPASFSNTPVSGKGAFDPQAFRAPNGNLFLYFKALDNERQLWGVRLTDTGLGRVGPGYGLVALDDQARTWEYSTRLHFTVLENPNMVYNPAPGVQRRFLLLYAGGEWQIPSNYGTGYAACTSPLGGCARLTTQRPWLYSRGTTAGPGAASTFTGPDGGPWIAYHSYRKGHVMDGWGRRLHVEPLRFAGVNPRLNNRRPTGTVSGNAPGGQVVNFTGTADDPDTGRPVRVSIRRDSVQIATATTGTNGAWNPGQLTGQPLGNHTYCAVAFDDNGLSARNIGCAVLDVT